MLLGSNVNGVTLSFGPTSNAPVAMELADAVSALIRPGIAPGRVLRSIHVSSTSEAYKDHAPGGPHRAGRAIDISAINGRPILGGYGRDAEVTDIVDAIQLGAVPMIRICENFGPRLYQKEGAFVVRSDHKDHIHLRVHSLREVMVEVAGLRRRK